MNNALHPTYSTNYLLSPNISSVMLLFLKMLVMVSLAGTVSFRKTMLVFLQGSALIPFFVLGMRKHPTHFALAFQPK